ncbi:histidinol-phosphate aminotransferase [Fontimonas thermophila]|uniref:Histidinol-phosphate aminotransferase n=1 Tax=Fontimonas thermophila TaxID=1076937 RepID=A0A1I2HNS3_9GAMM|nr:histidinol-phosphate transaminase [Fontimonas thermophila]SFF30950.1 histidinol-phosphate aminotransferase [Fontimonas thermophila]
MREPLLQRAAPGVLDIEPYTPGMPIEELQRRLGIGNAIKLASNENPLGMSPKVRAALAAALESTNLALYPDGSGHRLKRKLAAMHDIAPECITLGNGSNDILEFLARTYAGPGRAVMFSAYAFAVYPLAAQAQSAESVVVPARPADDSMPYGHDMDAFARMLRARPDVALVFIANPNNPTGTWLEPTAIEHFLEQVPPDVIVALDEAYYDYQDPALRPDTRRWLDRFPNLLVARTFSKVYGLAGLRIGYALSHPTVADLLNRVRQPFNNNSLALLAAEVALDDQDFVRASVVLNARERARLTRALTERGLRVLPSQANFVAVDFGRDARPIHQGLLERGVIVRPMGSYGLPTFLRVTVGTEAENDRFLQALDEALTA